MRTVNQDLQTLRDAARAMTTSDGDEARALFLAAIAELEDLHAESPISGDRPRYKLVPMQEMISASAHLQNVAAPPGQYPQIGVQIFAPFLTCIVEEGRGVVAIADACHLYLWQYAQSIEHAATQAIRGQRRDAKKIEDLEKWRTYAGLLRVTLADFFGFEGWDYESPRENAAPVALTLAPEKVADAYEMYRNYPWDR